MIINIIILCRVLCLVKLNILSLIMRINPFDQHSNTHNTSNPSKKPQIPPSQGLIPMSLKMLNNCLQNSTRTIDGIDFTKIHIVAQVLQQQRINHKYILIISDQSAACRLIKPVTINKEGDGPNENDQLEIGQYYEFIVSVREDKQEAFVLYCEKARMIGGFAEINQHLVRIMLRAFERKNFVRRD